MLRTIKGNYCRSGLAIVGLALVGCSGLDQEQVEQGEALESSSLGITVGAVVAFEAETLTRTASSVGSKVTSESAASAGKYVEFAGTAAQNAWMEFTLTNIEAGPYDLKFLFKSNNNRGIVQASIDGVNQGSTCNQYAATAAQKVACSLGSKTLTAGSHKIRFTVTGKGASSSGYQMVVDQISLTYKGTCSPTSPAPQFATHPQSFAVPCNNNNAWVSFTASPSSGTTVASYQWYYSYLGSTVANKVTSTDRFRVGGTTQTLQVAPQTSQNVWLVITDTCGRTATSNKAGLMVPTEASCLDCSVPPGASTPPTSITASKPSPICAGTATILTVAGGSLGAGASWVWYTNSAHTVRVGTGASITVSPTVATTYYVRAEGSCNSTASVSRAVTVAPAPQFAQNPQSFAAPCNSTTMVNFTAAPMSGTTVASVQWFVQYVGAGTTEFVPDSNNRYFSGQTTLNLKVAPQNSVNVRCVITDTCGAQASSTRALLTVPDPSTCQ